MKKLLKILGELYPEVDFESERELSGERALGSLDMVTLVSDICAEYGVSISPDDITPENFKSIDTVAALIKASGGDIECL